MSSFWFGKMCLGARTLLGAPGLTTRSKKLLGTGASLLVTSALLVVTRTLRTEQRASLRTERSDAMCTAR